MTNENDQDTVAADPGEAMARFAASVNETVKAFHQLRCALHDQVLGQLIIGRMLQGRRSEATLLLGSTGTETLRKIAYAAQEIHVKAVSVLTARAHAADDVSESTASA